MRAKEEYQKWHSADDEEESAFSRTREQAYITGFNRAVELMSKLIKENLNESPISIPKRKASSGQRGKTQHETFFSD